MAHLDPARISHPASRIPPSLELAGQEGCGHPPCPAEAAE